jgi:hypothetical protein
MSKIQSPKIQSPKTHSPKNHSRKARSSKARSSNAHASKAHARKAKSHHARARKSRAPATAGEAAHDSGQPERSPREIVSAWFGFHRVCPQRACRRAMRCCGGAMPPCFTLCWPHVPERDKVAMRAIFAARHAGASVADAMEAGEIAVVKWDALTFGLSPPPGPDGEQGREQVHEKVPAQQLRHNAPRIRA